MIMRKTILLALLFLSIQSYAQIEHLIVLDISDLGGEKKSIYSSIDACNDLVDNLDYQRNNYLVYVCNAQSPIIISNDDDFDKEIEEVYQLDPDIPNPLNTIESIIESLGDKELSNGFKIHYSNPAHCLTQEDCRWCQINSARIFITTVTANKP